MKNAICRLCNREIEDTARRKGYWATDPKTPECPGNEVLLVGHSSCVDGLAKMSKTRVVTVDISGIEKARQAEIELIARLNAGFNGGKDG